MDTAADLPAAAAGEAAAAAAAAASASDAGSQMLQSPSLSQRPAAKKAKALAPVPLDMALRLAADIAQEVPQVLRERGEFRRSEARVSQRAERERTERERG